MKSIRARLTVAVFLTCTSAASAQNAIRETDECRRRACSTPPESSVRYAPSAPIDRQPYRSAPTYRAAPSQPTYRPTRQVPSVYIPAIPAPSIAPSRAGSYSGAGDRSARQLNSMEFDDELPKFKQARNAVKWANAVAPDSKMVKLATEISQRYNDTRESIEDFSHFLADKNKFALEKMQSLADDLSRDVLKRGAEMLLTGKAEGEKDVNEMVDIADKYIRSAKETFGERVNAIRDAYQDLREYHKRRLQEIREAMDKI